MFRAAKDYIDGLIARHPRALKFGAGFGAVVLAFALPIAAWASIRGFFLGLIAELFAFLTEGMAYLMFLEVRGMLVFAQYSNFVNPGPKAVEYGWIVTRDLANMFFILIMLVIAFGTILGREEYGYKRALPRLLFMAVVINFSKTICGIIIDFGQVVMLTFVNGFIQAAGGNFLRAFQIDKLLDLKPEADPHYAKLALGMMLAFILVTVATAVVLVMMVMLAWRIIVLWLLIIMSPIAFLSNAVGKSGAGYYSKWWEKFRSQIIVGPMLAFFLWLTLIAVQASGGNIAAADRFADTLTAADQEIGAQSSDFPTEVSRTDLYLSFVIAVCMLMAGLQLAIESSDGLAKSFGNKVSGGLKKAAAFLPKKAQEYAARTVSKGAKKGVELAKSPYTLAKGGVAAAGRRLGEAANRGIGTRLAKSRFSTLAGAGRRMALSGEQARAERLKKKYGTSKLADVARLSPNQFNKFASKAEPEEAAEFASIYQNNPALLAQAQSTGAAKNISDALRKKAKPDADGNFTDAAGAKAYNDFMKANWAQETDPEKRKKLFKGMSDEESLRYLGAKDIVPDTVKDLDKSNITALMSKGTPQQQQALAGTFEAMERTKPGSIANFLSTRGISPAQVPAGFLNANVAVQRADGSTGRADGGEHFANAILRAGRRDPSVASKMAENPKTAQKMGAVALADMKQMQLDRAAGKTVNKIDFNNAVNVAVQTGNLSTQDVAAMKADLVASFDVKDLSNMVRYAPPDRSDIQEAIREAVTAIHDAGGDVAKRIAQNPQLSEYIKKSAGQGASQAVAQATPPPTSGGAPYRGAGAYSRRQQGGGGGGTPPTGNP